MSKPLFTPVAGLVQDILLLSTVFLFATGLSMVVALRVGDYLIARKRRKTMIRRIGQPLIQ